MHSKTSIPQLAARLRLSYLAARNLALRGEVGPLYQEGRHWFVTDEGIVAYIERTKPPADSPLAATHA